MSDLVKGSPFLIPMGDLLREKARLDQIIAGLQEELKAAYKEIARLERLLADEGTQ